MSESVEIIAGLGGEVVTYLPYGGVARTFKAIVERQPSQVQTSQGAVVPVNAMEVQIPKDGTSGVSVIQVRKDRMQFKKMLSDAQVSDFTVMKILQEDAGMTPADGGMFRVLVQS